jgi:hypothetical protein
MSYPVNVRQARVAPIFTVYAEPLRRHDKDRTAEAHEIRTACVGMWREELAGPRVHRYHVEKRGLLRHLLRVAVIPVHGVNAKAAAMEEVESPVFDKPDERQPWR